MTNSGANHSESLKNNRKLKVFLLFLLLSFVFWSLIKLSKEYISEVEFDLNYIDIPNNKLIQNEPQKKISLTLRTLGFKLLSYGFNKRMLNYSLTGIEQKKGSLYFSETNSNTNFLQAQLSAETVILNIEPDTLFFDLGAKRSKKVKVVPKVDFDFRTGFNFIKPYVIEPDYIEVSGPEKVIDTIDEVFSQKVIINDISTSFEHKVNLLSPNNAVVLSQENLTVKGEVDKITDGSYLLPFKVINLPKNYIISTYPKKVKIVYQVALKDYNKIPENGFKVVCDYRQTEDNQLDYLIPRLIEKPEIISDVKIIPGKIDFLIKK